VTQKTENRAPRAKFRPMKKVLHNFRKCKIWQCEFSAKNIREIKWWRKKRACILPGWRGERSLQFMSRKPQMVNHLGDLDACKGIILKWMDIKRNITWGVDRIYVSSNRE
jgi:hypothetical protein